jgi:hypothetical protein
MRIQPSPHLLGKTESKTFDVSPSNCAATKFAVTKLRFIWIGANRFLIM